MIKLPTWWKNRGLSSAEWLAENAFLPPGLHRLLTAFGLTSGLWLGRQFTDFVVARRSSDGTEIPRGQVPELFRPLHGVMKYNPYSDDPAERWKNVADGFLPVAFGVVGAYLGSKSFFHGKPSQFFFGSKMGFAKKVAEMKPFHPPSAAVKDIDEASLTIDQAVAKMHFHESNATRPLGAGGYVVSGTAGTHLGGALLPMSAGNIAIAFQIGAQRMINVAKTGVKSIDRYIVGFNRFMGNRSAGSVALPGALSSLVKWAEGNLEQSIRVGNIHPVGQWMTEGELMRRSQDALQIFKKLGDGDQEAVAKEIGKRLEGIMAKAKTENWNTLSPKNFSEKLNIELNKSFKGEGYQDLIVKGIQNKETWNHFSIIGNGPFSEIARVFGSAKKEEALLKHLAKKINPMLHEKFGPGISIKTEVKAHPLYVAGGALGIGGVTVGGLTMGAMHHQHERELEYETDPDKQNSRHAQADRAYTTKKERPKNAVEWINGAPLDASQWFSRILIQPPSMHRFMNALFLSGALFGGYKFANILTGRNLLTVKSANNFANAIEKGDVWKPLQPLHGLLSYTPGSSASRDRLNAALHMIIPVGIGAVGTMTGSHFYFRDRIDHIKASKAEYLEDYADKAALEQSKFFATATGITSIFNTGSGIHLLPFFNYSANMQNRFLMAGGYQVALPGVGKWWSGNEGLYPWGIKRTLNFTANYLAYNPDEFPEQLPSLMHSVVAKLYPDPEYKDLAVKERQLLEEIYKVRDQYLVNGKIPEEKRPELLKVMKGMLTGAGLEKTLMSVGLDPREADIAHNGASGALANTFGQGDNVARLRREYVERFSDRIARQKEDKETQSPSKIERPISERTFSERLKREDHTIPVAL